ncbi:MAG: PadR family transcriptional regulator [Desulfovibrio sp.]|uniref:PadR family transcriptional regulator n=1 Tax=Desulfovibrio sp. TaxID=885 RepID=UPI0039E3CF40
MNTLKKLKTPLHPDEDHGADCEAPPNFSALENSHFEGCACTGKNLTRLVRPAILAVLARENLHGYLILERLAERAMFNEQPADPAGIYRVLKSMELEGLVTCAWDMQGSGPARRQYALTDRGRSCLGQWLGTLEEYLASVQDIVDNARSALAAEPPTAPLASSVSPKNPADTDSARGCRCAAKPLPASIDSSGPFSDS